MMLRLAPSRKVAEGWQRILRTALAKLQQLRVTPGPPDDWWWEQIREATIEAGADDACIRALAAHFACVMLAEIGAGNPEGCLEQLELIGEHLACRDMEIRVVGTGDSARVQVEFPGCERIH